MHLPSGFEGKTEIIKSSLKPTEADPLNSLVIQILFFLLFSQLIQSCCLFFNHKHPRVLSTSVKKLDMSREVWVFVRLGLHVQIGQLMELRPQGCVGTRPHRASNTFVPRMLRDHGRTQAVEGQHRFPV